MVKKELDIAEDTDPVSNPMIHDVIAIEPGRVVPTICSGYSILRPTDSERRPNPKRHVGKVARQAGVASVEPR